MPSTVSSSAFANHSSNSESCSESGDIPYPWFWLVTYVCPVSRLVQGLFWPLCPYFSLYVLALPASPSICAPRHMPRVGTSFFIRRAAVCMVSWQFSGSPGPLLMTTPAGSYDITSSYGVFHGTSMAPYPSERTLRSIAYFAPVSITTIGFPLSSSPPLPPPGFAASPWPTSSRPPPPDARRRSHPYARGDLVDTASMNCSDVYRGDSASLALT